MIEFLPFVEKSEGEKNLVLIELFLKRKCTSIL